MTVPDKEIEAAFYSYLGANFSECAVHWPGMEFSTADKTEWIQPRIFAVTRKPARRGQGFSTYLVNINVFVKHGADAYRIMEIADALYSLFDQKDVVLPHPGVLSGLLRWYGFEGSCADRMGLGDGTPTDIYYVASRPHFGTAVYLPGLNTSDVVVADAADLQTLPALTVSGHIYPKTAGENDLGMVASKYYYLGPGGWEFHVSDPSGGLVRIQGKVYCATTDAEARSTRVVPLNGWTHVAMTWDNATKLISLYINGVEATYEPARTAGVGDQRSDAGGHVIIGSHFLGGAAGFDGYEDDMRFYNRILSAAEIRAIAGGLGFQFSEMEHRRIPSGEESLDQVNIETRFFVS